LNFDREIARLMGHVNHMKSIDSRTGCTVETDILDIHFRILILALRALVILNTAGNADPLSRQRQDVGSSSPGPNTGRTCIFVSSAFRDSRVCFRRRIFCRCSRPNLALSPFLSDIIPSLVSPLLWLQTRNPIRLAPLHSDSLPGVRLVIGGIESIGRLFHSANETRKVTTQTESSQRNVFRESVTGTMGLKSTAIATNPVAQKYLRSRNVCATTRRAVRQTTILSSSR